MNDNKNSEDESIANKVDEYLQTLGNDDAREMLYYSQEQDFSAEELTSLVNEKHLNELLAKSDDFLNSLNSEIEDFDE